MQIFTLKHTKKLLSFTFCDMTAGYGPCFWTQRQTELDGQTDMMVGIFIQIALDILQTLLWSTQFLNVPQLPKTATSCWSPLYLSHHILMHSSLEKCIKTDKVILTCTLLHSMDMTLIHLHITLIHLHMTLIYLHKTAGHRFTCPITYFSIQVWKIV